MKTPATTSFPSFWFPSLIDATAELGGGGSRRPQRRAGVTMDSRLPLLSSLLLHRRRNQQLTAAVYARWFQATTAGCGPSHANSRWRRERDQRPPLLAIAAVAAAPFSLPCSLTQSGGGGGARRWWRSCEAASSPPPSVGITPAVESSGEPTSAPASAIGLWRSASAEHVSGGCLSARRGGRRTGRGRGEADCRSCGVAEATGGTAVFVVVEGITAANLCRSRSAPNLWSEISTEDTNLSSL
nr:hypothetical protein Iba_scaffold3996CG0040 [Ipomoea batatas]